MKKKSVLVLYSCRLCLNSSKSLSHTNKLSLPLCFSYANSCKKWSIWQTNKLKLKLFNQQCDKKKLITKMKSIQIGQTRGKASKLLFVRQNALLSNYSLRILISQILHHLFFFSFQFFDWINWMNWTHPWKCLPNCNFDLWSLMLFFIVFNFNRFLNLVRLQLWEVVFDAQSYSEKFVLTYTKGWRRKLFVIISYLFQSK